MDLRELTDEQLLDHENAVINERERRQRLAIAPAQIAAIGARYVEDGGDKAALTAVLEAARPAE